MAFKNFEEIPELSSFIVFAFGIWAAVLNFSDRDIPTIDELIAELPDLVI